MMILICPGKYVDSFPTELANICCFSAQVHRALECLSYGVVQTEATALISFCSHFPKRSHHRRFQFSSASLRGNGTNDRIIPCR
jgi:hypothetical protein